jgi:hypothetical protein
MLGLMLWFSTFLVAYGAAYHRHVCSSITELSGEDHMHISLVLSTGGAVHSVRRHWITVRTDLGISHCCCAVVLGLRGPDQHD